MEPQSSIPVRTSGIPRPTSRLPVLRSSNSQSTLRPTPSTEQLRKKPSISAVSKPNVPASSLQKKPSRTSLVRSTTPATAAATTATASTNRSSLAGAPTNASTSRASLGAASKRAIPGTATARTSTGNVGVFKKPIGRPASRQTRAPSSTSVATRNTTQEDDGLGDLDAFRSASRASSRASFREPEQDYVLQSDSEPVDIAPTPKPRTSRPSLSDRTIESLSQLPSSPAGGKARRRSSFFKPDNSMAPPIRPASALGNNRRPLTSDGTPQATPATPQRLAGVSQRGSMTAPGKRSVSAAVASPLSTPTKTSSVARPASLLKKQPLSQMHNVQATPKPRPLSNSKTAVVRTPKARPSLAGTFGEAISPPGTAALTPPPKRQNAAANATPVSSRKISSSSAALREQIAKAKAASHTGTSPKPSETPQKASSSSNALREQIAKAKEAARRAHVAKDFGRGTPPREVPAVTENEYGIEPDPAEIAGFDFGLDDPFNQHCKSGKSVLKRRIDTACSDGRLNIAAMNLAEFPQEVLDMYKYDANNNNVAWGEVVDLTTIVAADNEFKTLPEELFPDVDIETMEDSDENGPQFGGVQTLDLHGNVLCELPVGLRRLSQLSKLNLSRNRLSTEIFDVISQVTTLRELKLAENTLEGALPSSIASLSQLEVLELQGNKLTSLPTEIRELVHLRTLNVSGNKLSALPSELFTSVPMIELFAGNNAFSGSFFNVDTVPNLQVLHLANNSISSLCATGMVLLPSLKSLNVSINRLSALPDVSSWTSLTTLHVGENKLTAFPEGFVSLHQLRNADFTGNDITKLDEKIALMEALENLILSANPLRERKFLTMNTEDMKRALRSRIEPSATESDTEEDGFPGNGAKTKSGWDLKPSGTLDLSFQNITEVDGEAMVEFAEANVVRQLYLQQNYLTAIPVVLSHFTHLSVLDLSKNSIGQPLTDTLELPKLRELRLVGNKMQSLTEITAFLSAPSLQHLDVSNNRISGPLPILRKTFPELFLLMASDNAISEVSAKSLEGLKTVNISNNDISRLDPNIGLLSATLKSLEVEGNTFRVPNYAVLRKGTEAVLAWLRDKIPSPTEEFFVAPTSPVY